MTAFRRQREQAGLSLLELLVAFSILALSMGLIYRVLGGNARSSGDMAVRQQAVLLAKSILASHDAVPPVGWTDSGVSASMGWSVTSRPYDAGLTPGTAPLHATFPDAVRLHEVQVAVYRLDSGTMLLSTRTLLPQRKPLPGESAP
jgi:general secretion pathway protein I